MTDPVTCPQCNYSGYAPSAAVMLSPGELECPSCDGFDTPHGQGVCDCDDSDASDHECDIPCGQCRGGKVLCEHDTAG